LAFKIAPPPEAVPDSPEKILLELPRRKIPGVLLHQGQMMQKYVAEAQTASDVALQLPTGSGKTLVGLLIGEWLRRKNQERVVFPLSDQTAREPSCSAGRATIRPERSRFCRIEVQF
jgi:hypothetical protein